jgi:hypothetical protein
MNIFETDPEKKIFPRLVPQRVRIANQTEAFYYKIDYSSGYFLRRLFLKYPALMKDPTLLKWTPATIYPAGTVITPSAAWQTAHLGTNLALIQSFVGGITGAVEPIWPLTFGQVIADNTAIFTTQSAYTIQAPRLKIEFIDNAHFIDRQPEATQADLIGTPAQENNFLIEAPQPVDSDLDGLNWNAKTPPTMSAILNFLYKYGDTIKIRITGQELFLCSDGTTKIWTPNIADFLLIGYYCPTGAVENIG